MQEQWQTIETLLAKKEIKKAEILIAKHLRSDPVGQDQVRMLLLRAKTRLLSARPEDSIDDLLKIRATAPETFDNPVALELLADCYFARFELATVGFAERSDAHQAYIAYQEIISKFPRYENLGWVHYQLGRILLTQNQSEQAEEYFREALFASSTVAALTAYCYERLGFIAFYEWRDANKSLGFLNKAIDTYPVSEDRVWLVQVHILRSRVLREMRNYEQALTAAEMALMVASSDVSDDKMSLAEALLTTGELLSDIEGRERDVVNNLQQFLQVSRKPLGVDVTWSRVHEMLGDAHFKLGQYEAAVTAYNAVLQYNPYYPWEVSLYYRIARCLYQQREYNRAIDAINQMLNAAKAEGQRVDDYRVYDVLGNAQFALGRYDKASEAYRLALTMAPANADNIDKIKTYYHFAQELS
jgi:tetratricopeptide (TPR) repeat protein